MSVEELAALSPALAAEDAALVEQLVEQEAALAECQARVSASWARRAEIAETRIAQVLAAVSAEDFWSDPGLRAWAATTEWARGRGHRELEEFISSAFTSRAGPEGGLYRFGRVFSATDENGEERVGLVPVVALRRRQPVEDLADGLVAMVEPLCADLVALPAHGDVGEAAGRGELLVEVLGEVELDGCRPGSVTLLVDAAGTGVVREYGTVVREGVLVNVLAWLAERTY